MFLEKKFIPMIYVIRNIFLVLKLVVSSQDIFLSQRKYVLHILDKIGVLECNLQIRLWIRICLKILRVIYCLMQADTKG